jgi:hypothetical protein
VKKTDETKTTAAAILSELAHFTGGETLYRHWLGLTYTEGVRFLAERCGAFWLIDLVGSHLPAVRRDRKARGFCVWRLAVSPDGSAEAVCDDGDDRVIVRQVIEWTDFPLQTATLYLEYGALMLPSER